MHKIFELSNGIRVVTENIDYVKSVSAGVWIYAGSVNESLKNNGVSHFIEHMLFKGTMTRTAKDIAECMDAVGGQLNAMTARQYTCYYTKTLTEHLEMAFELLSDMLLNSTFTQENIDVERKVILEEINMTEDSPEDYIHDILTEAMWKGEALGFPIAGTADTLAGIDRDCILDYYRERYIADNIVISVVGNFNEEKALEALEKLFGGMKKHGIIRENQKKLEHTQRIEIVKKDIEQCQLCLGFEGYSRSDNRNYALSVVNALFGGNMSSRLFQKVREESGLAYSIYSFSSSYQSNGSLTVCAGLNTESLCQALKIISGEIKLLKREKLSKDEIETAKTQLKASVVMGSESISARMSSYGKSLMFDSRMKTIDDIIDLIDKIKPEDVSEVIDFVFDRNRMTAAILGRVEETEQKILNILDF